MRPQWASHMLHIVRVFVYFCFPDTNMNTSTIVPSNSTTTPPSSSHDIGKIIWILIGCGALLCIVVVIIVMKCVSAQRTKKTLHDSSNLQASHAQEVSGFTLSNTIHTKNGWFWTQKNLNVMEDHHFIIIEYLKLLIINPWNFIVPVLDMAHCWICFIRYR